MNVLLLDVTPLSICVETMGGVMTALIPSNSKYEEDKKYPKLEEQGVIPFGCEKEQSIQSDNSQIDAKF